MHQAKFNAVLPVCKHIPFNAKSDQFAIHKT